MKAFTRPEMLGGGLLVSLALLLLTEALLHSDQFLYRYRSVFAAGRAMDKVLFVERTAPSMLIIGNSRVDNGFDPVTLADSAIKGRPPAFNLGIPGANARIQHGILSRLEARGLLGPKGIRRVVIGLDESFVQSDNSLGYTPFFAKRDALWRQHAYADWLRTWIRLWGYGGNFKELREPEKMLRFASATFRDIEPVGGGAAQFLGYRAGFGRGFQNLEQVQRQEAGAREPPDANTLRSLWEMIELLQRNQVEVAVVFPPMFNRQAAYLLQEPWAAPYREIVTRLAYKNIPAISLDPFANKRADEFINPGHLNDRGAQRYTRLLREQLSRYWPDLTDPNRP